MPGGPLCIEGLVPEVIGAFSHGSLIGVGLPPTWASTGERRVTPTSDGVRVRKGFGVGPLEADLIAPSMLRPTVDTSLPVIALGRGWARKAD